MVGKMTIWSYFEPFLYTKEYLHLADISKRLGKPHSTVRKYMNIFEEFGVLKKTVKGRLTMYKLNLSSPKLVDSLSAAEKDRMMRKRDKEPLLNEVVSFLQDKLPLDSIALIFGSAVGSIKKAEDIDLLVVGEPIHRKEIEEFENKFGVEIHLIKSKSLDEIKEGLKVEIRKKHLIIQGTEAIVRWLL